MFIHVYNTHNTTHKVLAHGTDNSSTSLCFGEGGDCEKVYVCSDFEKKSKKCCHITGAQRFISVLISPLRNEM